RKVLSELPDDTIVSVSFFAGNDDKGVPVDGIEPVLQNLRWQKAKTDEVIDSIVLKRPRDGTQTGIAAAIKATFAKENLGKIFPGKQFTGFRNIVVITDGADNVSDNPANPTPQPGQEVVQALTNPDLPDVGLHLVLFGINEKEYKAARIQFDAIEGTQNYETRGRTPAQIWPKHGDGKVTRLERSIHLSEALKEAMPPRATTRRKDNMAGHLPVSIAAEKRWAWLDPLQDPGRYQLWALESRQTLQLDPADRLLLELKRGKDGIEIALPSYIQARPDLPVRTRATSADGIVHLTVPRNSLAPRASA